jgi:hypothetical protein
MSVHFIRRGRRPLPLDKTNAVKASVPALKIVLSSTDLDGQIEEAGIVLTQARALAADIKTNADYDRVYHAIDSAKALVTSLVAQRQARELAKAATQVPA